MEKAKTEKKSTRPGKPIGLKGRALVSIAVNDEERNVSRLWQTVKRYYSGKHQTAAETARRVIFKGFGGGH